MNQVQKAFNYQGSQVRTFLKDNEPWFIAKDVCDALRLTNPSESIKALDDDEKTTLRISEGGPEANIINEPGLYSLIIRSNKPEAKKFKRWITHEVLPSIRQTGAYIDSVTSLAPAPSQELQMIKLLCDNAINQELKVNTLEEKTSTLEEKVTKLEENSPENLQVPVLPVSQIQIHVMEHLMKKDMLSTSQIAGRYGMSAVSFYRLLHTFGFVQPAENIKGWVLDPKYVGMGVGSNDSNGQTDDGAHAFVYWTPKGRELIEKSLLFGGVKPIRRLARKKKIHRRNTAKRAGAVI